MVKFKTLPPADKPAEALAAVVSLRLMADRLERKAVRNALKLGWTWAEIAEALGVTRQAAHKRHARFIQKPKRRRKEDPNVQKTQITTS